MRLISICSLSILVLSSMFGQKVIDNFEYANPDTSLTHAVEGNLSSFVITQNTGDKQQGTSSIEVNAVIGAYHPWGSYATFGNKDDGATTEDWTESDSISLWLKVKAAPKQPQYMVFRIQIADKPTADASPEEYIYENASVIDATTGWINLRVPLIERQQDGGGTLVPDSTGFILVPTSWGGFTYNNRKLDRDKILHWTIGIITSGYIAPDNIPADSVDILFDDFTRFGVREFPVTLFNGKDFTLPATGSWAWGAGSSVSVVEGAGNVTKSNAIKFVESSEWGGWGGWGVDMASTNMLGAWPKDTFHVAIKAEAGGDDTLRAQFESSGGKRAIKFAVTRDNAWHNYSFALKDFLFDDGAPNFDTSAVIKFGIMENGHNATGGQIDYFTNIWTGNPVFDVIPPDAPSNVSVVTTSQYSNSIIWTDVAAETGGRYNVYWDYKPWAATAVDSPWVKDVPPYNVAQGLQIQTQLLRSPVTDQNVTVYYGVVAKDEAGNVSDAALSSSATNKAKGVPIIVNKTVAFNPDGNVSEWSSITPFNLSINNDSHVNPNGKIDGDNDCSAKAYLAMDNDNLYVAFDVTDDVVDLDTTGNSYEHDAPDFFIGLYDFAGKYHSGLKTGDNADYHFRFGSNRILLDNASGATVYYPGANYVWKKKTLTSGYVVEAKIPFARLNEVVTANTKLFVPKSGMRIALDFEINDRDNATASDFRDGMLCYSKLNDDNSYQDQWRWTYTWYDATTLGVQQANGPVNSFELSQNFPNPFNPATEIHFALAKDGFTTLTVYDVLGREVTKLVNGFQSAGNHTVTFNGSHLSSGMYLYRIESGAYTAVKKMLLTK